MKLLPKFVLNVNHLIKLWFMRSICNGKHRGGGLNSVSWITDGEETSSTVKILTSTRSNAPIYSLKGIFWFLFWSCIQWAFFMPHWKGRRLFSGRQGMVLFPAGHDLSVKCICNFQISPPLQDLRQQDGMKKDGTSTATWIIWGPVTSPLTALASLLKQRKHWTKWTQRSLPILQGLYPRNRIL